MKTLSVCLVLAAWSLTLWGQAFLYWSCQVQNSLLNPNDPCDCQTVVTKNASGASPAAYTASKWQDPVQYTPPFCTVVDPVLVPGAGVFCCQFVSAVFQGHLNLPFKPPAVDLV
ncbi:MAG: hypothetical protein EAZ62_08535 [Sphingobacteriia bacterium]|nr:MAG: hypothetical protein EAZ62_08535 [Sphingobacteriia bacterium]